LYHKVNESHKMCCLKHFVALQM